MVKEDDMGSKLAFLFFVALSAIAFPANQAQSQTPGVSVEIERLARLTDEGIIVLWVHVTCGPFEGVEDFQEALAGAGQAKTGAGAEGGLDGTVVCDGVERVHTAHLTAHTDAAFKRGPAGATASVFVCTLVGDEQICFRGAMSRRVILRGGPG
jgi:hypothetical protein